MKKFFALSLLSFLILPVLAGAQEIDLLWQGNVYTPPFYEGRPLWSKQSNITLYAIPRIPGVSNRLSLEYKWTKDSVVQGNISGVGKNTFSFSDSIFGKPVEVKVEVFGSDGALLASKSTTLTPQAPRVLVYENNPLYGILFNQEVGENYQIKGSEITLTSFPMFFSILGRDSGLMNYLWTTNSGSSENSNSITYKIPDGVSGRSSITAKISNVDKPRQSLEKNFLLQFEGQSNNGL